MTTEQARPREGESRQALAPLVLLSFAIVMTSLLDPSASASDAILGTVRDADTDEPIAAAWIFETERQSHAGADVEVLARVRTTRSDESGHFFFDESPSGFWNAVFGRRPDRRYAFFHPSYGLLRVRIGSDGHSLTMRPSLRDAHLRQADAVGFCNKMGEDEMSRTMRENACPRSRLEKFEEGSPRATGAIDEKGRRQGPWIFYRDDGSVIARGEYRSGGAVGRWHFEPRDSPTPNQD